MCGYFSPSCRSVTFSYHVGGGVYMVVKNQSDLFVLGDFEYASIFDFCKDRPMSMFGPVCRRYFFCLFVCSPLKKTLILMFPKKCSEEYFAERCGISATFDPTYDIKLLVTNIYGFIESSGIPQNNRCVRKLVEFAKKIPLTSKKRPRPNVAEPEPWIWGRTDIEIVQKFFPEEYLTRSPPPESKGTSYHIDIFNEELMKSMEDFKVQILGQEMSID